jgi:hypothetical protein
VRTQVLGLARVLGTPRARVWCRTCIHRGRAIWQRTISIIRSRIKSPTTSPCSRERASNTTRARAVPPGSKRHATRAVFRTPTVSNQFTCDRIRNIARAEGYSQCQVDDHEGVIAFRRVHDDHPELVRVWFRTRTVGTYIGHPRQGKTQLFRKNIQSYHELTAIFENPRVHTTRATKGNLTLRKRRKGHPRRRVPAAKSSTGARSVWFRTWRMATVRAVLVLVTDAERCST